MKDFTIADFKLDSYGYIKGTLCLATRWHQQGRIHAHKGNPPQWTCDSVAYAGDVGGIAALACGRRVGLRPGGAGCVDYESCGCRVVWDRAGWDTRRRRRCDGRTVRKSDAAAGDGGDGVLSLAPANALF